MSESVGAGPARGGATRGGATRAGPARIRSRQRTRREPQVCEASSFGALPQQEGTHCPLFGLQLLGAEPAFKKDSLTCTLCVPRKSVRPSTSSFTTADTHPDAGLWAAWAAAGTGGTGSAWVVAALRSH